MVVYYFLNLILISMGMQIVLIDLCANLALIKTGQPTKSLYFSPLLCAICLLLADNGDNVLFPVVRSKRLLGFQN